MRGSWSVMVLLLVTGTVGAADSPVAIVAELNGNGSLTAGGETRPVQLFDRLAVGDAVELEARSGAVVAFISGSRFKVEEKTRVTVMEEGFEVASGSIEALEPVATVPAITAIPAAQKPGRRSGAIRIRGGGLWGAEVEDLYPRDGATALPNATVLTFRSLLNTETYRVDVEDEIGETVFAVETRSTSVVVPRGVLLPETEYYWRVRSAGRRSMGGRGEALFVTLGEADADAREGLRTQAEEEGTVSSLLLLAEVDRSLGLYREACASLGRAAELAAENPRIGAARDAFRCEEYGARD